MSRQLDGDRYQAGEFFEYTKGQQINKFIIVLQLLPMIFTKNQSPKIGNIINPPLFIQQQQRRKYSADYKPRKNSDRIRDKTKQIIAKLPTPPNPTLQHKPTIPFTKQFSQLELHENTAHPEKNYKQTNTRQKSFISKKRLISILQPKIKREDMNAMFKNIDEVLRQNAQIIIKSNKPPQQKQSQKNGFLVMRSQLQQQLYKTDEHSENTKSTAPTAFSQQLKRGPLHDKQIRYTLNPFMADDTVTCCSAVLNKQEYKKASINCIMAEPSSASRQKNTSISISRKIIKINKSISKNLNFHLSAEHDNVYFKKLKSLIQFIFKVNFSNGIYVNLPEINSDDSTQYKKYKIFIGKGNNSLLIKSLIKRRFWWEITNNANEEGIDFYWSQSKIQRVHKTQKKANLMKQLVQIQKQMISRKVRPQGQKYELNKKIMSTEQSIEVENYILPDGFKVPFQTTYQPDIITNHLPRNHCIGSKKNLFRSLFHYHSVITHQNPFDFIPKTYHIHSSESPEYLQFCDQNKHQPNKIWIIKPGQNSNRGKSIRLSSFANISQCLPKSKHQNGQLFTYIVQSYINKPLLYENRKFDIRHYMMLTSINGCLKGYWYKEGYIRTSSHLFSLEDNNNLLVHLTNDAIQKKGQLYEKYEPANKLSYNQFQRYLDYTFPSKQYNFQRDILQKLKSIAIDIIKANYLTIDHARLANNFQIFGLDFMIDREFKPWLIQVNYNPCLQVNCHVLQKVIPPMLQNSIRLALDPLFPPPCHYPSNKRFYLSDNYLKHLKYELIFDERTLKEPISNEYSFQDTKFQQEQYQDEGVQVQQIQN